MHEPKVSLVEVFASPQGEGFNSGRAAVFVRFAGCPLACEFSPGVVCDTPYMQTNLKLTVPELVTQVGQLAGDVSGAGVKTPMVVLTGGEPTASPLFDRIAEALHNEDYYVAVETNGTLWKEGLERWVDWISCSPKTDVPQTSKGQYHNPNPKDTRLLPSLCAEMEARATVPTTIGKGYGGEYRYVLSRNSPTPPYHPATRHYVSPAVCSDGRGKEFADFVESGFPGFASGAVDRCLTLIEHDPRWRLSIQTHKMLGVR